MLKNLYNLISNNIILFSIVNLNKNINVPEYFLKYLLLIEDKRFNFHLGIDPIAIVRASINNLIYHDGACEGASTITQQLYSTSLEAQEKGYNRKIDGKLRQITWSLHKEINSSKAEIISEYLRTIYWGESYYGLDQAAAGYFGVTRNQLSHEQSFFLVERIAWPNIVNSYRIKQLISIPQISSDFNDFGRLENLALIYDRKFQCRENLCLILGR